MERIPRPEHPNPQFYRENWRSLNGTWEFEIDKSNAGEELGFVSREHFSREITVPFCPESQLSGVRVSDFMEAVWYKRSFCISYEERKGDVLLHFGAVDYECTVFVNGNLTGIHKGGYSSFQMDITSFLHPGENTLTVRAVDHTRCPLQPTGKQSERANSHGCFYTRTTGIWQSVWLEFVPRIRIQSFKLTPNPEACSVIIEVQTTGKGILNAECFYKGKRTGSRSVTVAYRQTRFELSLSEKHLWEVGHGRLYDLQLSFGEDTVSTYFGLRSIGFEGMKFLLNSRPVFQRLVLDQGFYPDGIYTAPDDKALLKDIQLSKKMGFNGARLHEKVFEPRFLYHCDKEGYLVWGEYPNWGLDASRPEALHVVTEEWLEVLHRDYNHPSIIGWCPFNETWDRDGKKQYDPNLSAIYHITKSTDPTRPCIDTSGNFHVITDIFCIHDYDQNPESFKAHYNRLMTEGILHDQHANRQTYGGEPVFLSEYGGIAWAASENGWGYGDAPQKEAEFLSRFEGLTDALLENDHMFGLCYTQLYDVEQEMNGLYTYDRKPKFPPETIWAILSKTAAIEKD